MDEIKVAEADVLKRVSELKATIDGILSDPKYPWFRDMLSAILESALTDYDLVLASLERPATMTAWARRCLLELRVVCEYVLASEPNATHFHEELLVDAKEFYKAATKYTKSGHQQVVTLLNELIESLPTGPQRTSLEEYAHKRS
jgi:hypothetical protein